MFYNKFNVHFDVCFLAIFCNLHISFPNMATVTGYFDFALMLARCLSTCAESETLTLFFAFLYFRVEVE